MVILEVEPPRDNGGKRVTGYRVEFGRKITDYAVGLSPIVINNWLIDSLTVMLVLANPLTPTVAI